eukprot:CAMPEP_0201602868 /NCGR_PEP_ID=MMETSP0492-20130828/3471_1 /ASSEMBLY_ACC=CAM_ASM_000837 /TAXON_ID=420259 /ORGANISM="Thalassiosira gravida, Strain GMp14c1" /LENGTH=530 /DNA_ID=CAMNT_0048066501 /DNA_START=116 /DNA_END=1708 /DNA_ORIENTATION=+
MAKISNYALVAFLAGGATLTSAECTGEISSFSGECNYQNFFDNRRADCDIDVLFAGTDPEEEVKKLCRYDAPVQFVEIKGTYQNDRRYFKGSGPLVDGGNYKQDSARLQRFETNMGSKTLIGFPEYAARMTYNANNDLATADEPNGYPANMNLFASCQLNTVMCCFTDDSNGEGFASNGDATTDVCRHNLADSPQSNHIKYGWSVFPGTETSTHCHGFTWKDGEDELLGNMMYDISYRTTINKGYLKGVPGAPMCGCVEHMPTVEAAACRTATKTGEIEFTFSYEEGIVSASNTATINYQDCAVADLKKQYVANNAGDADKIAAIDDHLAGDGGCADDLTEYLNEEQFLHESKHVSKYVTPDPAEWSDLVVGEGIYFLPSDSEMAVADAAFRDLINAGCKEADGADRHCIIRRVCASCTSEPHRDIYYQRLTALPPSGTNTTEVYLINTFMNSWSKTPANDMAAGDFALYSTYQDALDGTNAWTWCDYGTEGVYGFPRNCGVTTYMHNQWNSYKRNGAYANHHGFYVELP